ncbi:uncharacterized protein HGUI_01084 [Hanseniaspora guilliermondii]|uniref:T6SS Phospholipase effector Tle1-like catalytic domain-containing protein n=1 Tax=Hanseniaspora guilliermondii TaxID=56406 RepID=A0A1L0AZB1_9ASCO|nr:uncharacterized protein HGUI_01084 [Hanseniaspora guilliermondii]
MGVDENVLLKYGKDYGVIHNFYDKIYRVVDSCLAISLDSHIFSAYLFLMHNYNNGDLIYMIGFSRGALLCRILAGFLERVGILDNGNKHLLNDAWTLYQGWEYLELKSSEPQVHTTLLSDFRNTFSKPFDVVVEFLGLFDTVNSSGILNDRIFPFTARSGIVNHIRHALSIDERREKYKPHIFLPNPANYSNCHDLLNEVDGECNFYGMFNYIAYVIEKHTKLISFKRNSKSSTLKRNNFLDYTLYINTKLSPILDRAKIFAEYKAEPIVSTQRVFVEGVFKIQLARTGLNTRDYFTETGSSMLSENLSSDLIEKWFSGDHADVGGGWHIDDDVLNEFQMSNIPLRWMIVECMKHGITFKRKQLRKYIQAVPAKKCFLAHQHDSLSLENTTWGRHSYYFKKNTKPLKSIENGVGIIDEEIIQNTKRTLIAKDSIFIKLFWWVIEFVPMRYRVQNLKTMKWETKSKPNFGKRRQIPVYADLHWSVIWRMKYLENYRPSNINESFKWILQNEAQINFNSHQVDHMKKSPVKRVLPLYLGTTTIKDYSKPRKSPLTSPYVSYPYRKLERLADLTQTDALFSMIKPISNDRSNSTNTTTSVSLNSNCVFMDEGGNYLTQVSFTRNDCNLTRFSFDSYVIEELKRVELELVENIKKWEKDGFQHIPDELYNYMIENHML